VTQDNPEKSKAKKKKEVQVPTKLIFKSKFEREN
jgi:hypothetical protein